MASLLNNFFKNEKSQIGWKTVLTVFYLKKKKNTPQTEKVENKRLGKLHQINRNKSQNESSIPILTSKVII